MRRHRDALLALALVVAAQAELALAGADGHRAFYTALALLIPSLVAIRRRAPMAALLIASGAFALLGMFGLSVRTTAEVVAFVILVFTAGQLLPRRRALLVLGVAAVALIGEAIGKDETADVAFVFLVFILPPWLIGRAIRDRDRRLRELEQVRAALEAEHARARTLAVEAERARVAREMHDVLSHSVGLITLQAGAGERLAVSDPAAARETLRIIAGAARRAAEELEHVLVDAESAPGLDQLVAGVRAAGVAVDLRLEQPVAPPAAVALAAERIVQEALTNVLKHSGARHVTVVVRAGRDAVDVAVSDDGSGTGEGGGSGRGLIGMRERVAAYGGRLEAGPRPGGGFAVHARLPLVAR